MASHLPFISGLKRGVLLLAAVWAVTGCVSAPSIPPAAVVVPAQWQGQTSVGGAQLSEAWWRDFDQGELSALVEQALLANRDLQIAAARVAQARAVAGVVDSERSPQLGAMASANQGRQTVLDPKTTVLRAGLQASWEVDVVGQKGLASRAAQLDAESAELLRQATETVVAADLTMAYLDAATLSQREALGQARLALMQQAADTAQKLFAAGRVTRNEIDRQEALARAYAAELAQLRSERQQRLLQLNLLLGTSPGRVNPRFAEIDRLQPMQAALWQPGELLERRPDVQRVAKEVEAAAVRVGIAKRDLYPRFVFNWSDAREHARLTGQAATTEVALGYGLALSLPILDGGRIRSAIQANEARLQEAMASYEKAMLEALSNAEGALTQQEAAAIRQAELSQARDAAEAAALHTQRLFEAGQVDKSSVLESQQAALQAQDIWLQAREARWLASVDVIRAFAGRVKQP